MHIYENNVNVCAYMYNIGLYIYIYIYVLHIYIYIYIIHINIHTCMHIYISSSVIFFLISVQLF